MSAGGKGRGGGGYKYFGRAKDLPGVKELFTSKRTDEDGEDGGRGDRYRAFRNLPQSYYGDEDEDDGVLLEEERRAEEAEWEEGYRHLLQGLSHDLRRRDRGTASNGGEEEEEMDVSDDEAEDMMAHGGIEIPSIPRPNPKPWKESMQAFAAASSTQPPQKEDESISGTTESNAKRPQAETETTEDGAAAPKRQKGSDGTAVPPATVASAETTAESAPPPAAISYSIFSPEDLQHPTVPDRTAIEKMILQARKRQLREEYIGSNST